MFFFIPIDWFRVFLFPFGTPSHWLLYDALQTHYYILRLPFDGCCHCLLFASVGFWHDWQFDNICIDLYDIKQNKKINEHLDDECVEMRLFTFFCFFFVFFSLGKFIGSFATRHRLMHVHCTPNPRLFDFGL